MSSDALHFPEAVRNETKSRLEVAPSESIERSTYASQDSLCKSGEFGDERAEQHPISPILEASATDEFLLSDAAKGSKEAIEILFRRYRRAVCNVANRILRDETEAEDLCQDVFLLLFQQAKLFDASKGSASSWIVQIAYHRAMNRRG